MLPYTVFERPGRGPFASVPSEPGGHTAGVNGVTIGRFGWADPVSGQVSSSLIGPNQVLGFVLPQRDRYARNLWNLAYWNAGALTLRKGVPLVLAAVGEFWTRFPLGCSIGQQVYANVIDGSAWTGIVESGEWTADSDFGTADSPIYTADGGGYYVLTRFRTASRTTPNGLALISTWQPALSS